MHSNTAEMVLDEHHTNPALLQQVEATKDKKKKRSSGKSKKPKPSGFEEYYVDPPVSPEEFIEEQALYSPSKSFEERFLLAIARYTHRRKLDQFRLNVFDKYMAYGGLGAGAKAFQGRVDEKDPSMTTLDAAIQKSKYHIKDGVLETSVVDFDGVVRGFFSSYLSDIIEMHSSEQVKACTNVVRNFLNYLLHHDVCPEYADQLYDAKKSCDAADVQLPLCSKLCEELPGTFNEACSILFGGYHQESYIEDIEYVKKMELTSGLRRDEAAKTFLAGLAALGTEAMVEAYNSQAETSEISIKTQETGHLEVITVEAPSREVLALYELSSQKGIRPVGSVKLQTWRHPKGPWPEMTPEEVAIYKEAPYEREQYTMFVDVNLLPLMMTGTKIYCTYYETSFGVWYFDAVLDVLSPMYTWLPNEPMMDWVVPKELPYKKKDPGAETDDAALAVVTGYDEPNPQIKRNEDSDDNDDMPAKFKNYEKGEDIVVTF